MIRGGTRASPRSGRWLWWALPGETQEVAHRPKADEPWNGEYYVSFGHGLGRNWEDARRYGFISAGGGSWYTRTLGMLEPGSRIWVNIPQTGYVAVGIVGEPMAKAVEFRVLNPKGDEVPLTQVPLEDRTMLERSGDESEYCVKVRWLRAVPLDQAVKERGFFGNQNTVPRPTTGSWRHILERLIQRFGLLQQGRVSDRP